MRLKNSVCHMDLLFESEGQKGTDARLSADNRAYERLDSEPIQGGKLCVEMGCPASPIFLDVDTFF